MPMESQVKSLLFIFEEYGIVEMTSLSFTNVNEGRQNIKLFLNVQIRYHQQISEA